MKKLIIGIAALAFASCNTGTDSRQCPDAAQQPQVRNVIYMIGDGMGLTQVSATMLSQPQPLPLERAQYVGLQKSQSASDKVTDSAASGTALSTGTKTNNGMIGVDPDKQPLQSVRALAEEAGMSTGVIATYSITDATPAAFVAHNESRVNQEAIAEDFLKTDIDLFIGGGRDYFNKRADGKNLCKELETKGYRVASSIDEIKTIEKGKVAGLLSEKHMPSMIDGRGDILPTATAQALTILSNNHPEGFFLMVEGSQIDGGGHANDAEKVITETVDFNAAVKVAFDYADSHPGTLVVVTADHETGGLTLPAEGNGFKTEFSTGGHTGMLIPVYAYGAGAENFSGIMDNTDIPKKIAKLLGLK